MLKFTPIERIVVALTSGVVTLNEKRRPEDLETPDLSSQDAALDHDLFKDIRDRQVETVASCSEHSWFQILLCHTLPVSTVQLRF